MDNNKTLNPEDPDLVLVPRSYLRPDTYIPGNLERCESPMNVIQVALGYYRKHPFLSDRELASTICNFLSESLAGRSIVKDGLLDIKFK